MGEITKVLQEEVNLFEWSSKLNFVVSGLQKIINGEKIDDIEKETFEWAGKLIGQIDLDSEHYKNMESPELCCVATQLRPKFYQAIIENQIEFNDELSERIYETLRSGGKNINLSKQELENICQVYKTISESLIAKLQ